MTCSLTFTVIDLCISIFIENFVACWPHSSRRLFANFDYFIPGKCNQINTNITPNRKIGKNKQTARAQSPYNPLTCRHEKCIHCPSRTRTARAAVAGPCQDHPMPAAYRSVSARRCCARLCADCLPSIWLQTIIYLFRHAGSLVSATMPGSVKDYWLCKVPEPRTMARKTKGLSKERSASVRVCKKNGDGPKGLLKLDSRNDELYTRHTHSGTVSEAMRPAPWRPRKYPLTEERVCFHLLDR